MMNHFGDGFMGGNTGIVPVTTLPADASTYGPRVLYYKYPVVASLPATVVNGARYVLDATKVEYIGRSVGVFSGTDLVVYPVPSCENGVGGNCEVGFIYRADGNPLTDSNICGQSSNPLNNIRIVHKSNGYLEIRLRNSNGSSFNDITSNQPITPNKWITVMYSIKDGFITAKFGDYTTLPLSLSGWAPTVSTETRLLGQASSGTRTFSNISNFYIKRDGIIFLDSPINDGSGVVISDTTINENDGTLTDGTPTTFWALAWVPLAAITKTVWVWDGSEWVQP